VVIDLTELVFADSSLMLDFAVLARRLRVQGLVLLLREGAPPAKPVVRTPLRAAEGRSNVAGLVDGVLRRSCGDRLSAHGALRPGSGLKPRRSLR